MLLKVLCVGVKTTREREREKGGRRRAVLPYSECPPKAQNFDDKNNSGEHHHGEREREKARFYSLERF